MPQISTFNALCIQRTRNCIDHDFGQVHYVTKEPGTAYVNFSESGNPADGAVVGMA